MFSVYSYLHEYMGIISNNYLKRVLHDECDIENNENNRFLFCVFGKSKVLFLMS